jgi:hypothetical protein
VDSYRGTAESLREMPDFPKEKGDSWTKTLCVVVWL